VTPFGLFTQIKQKVLIKLLFSLNEAAFTNNSAPIQTETYLPSSSVIIDRLDHITHTYSLYNNNDNEFNVFPRKGLSNDLNNSIQLWKFDGKSPVSMTDLVTADSRILRTHINLFMKTKKKQLVTRLIAQRGWKKPP